MYGGARLAVLSQLEYRLNLFTDAIVSPVFTAAIEVTLWSAILNSTATATLAGFSKASYIAYGLWGSFVDRVTANWMYEARMIEEVNSGAVNSVLARPISFYEYYLSQFLGYKLLSLIISIAVPTAVCLWLPGPTMLSRVPAAILLIIWSLVFTHTLSFMIATLAFFFNRVQSLTFAKNVVLWVLSGNLFPLDLLPEPFRTVLISLPFSSAVYVPVGYITGRLDHPDLLRGFLSTTLGLLVLWPLANAIWLAGRRRYSGTGA